MTEEENDWVYDFIFGKIASGGFRNPIKEFIDDNCISFIEVSENTFEQGALFNEFKELIENQLQRFLIECEITDEMFLEAAQKGLEKEKDKKYFEQLLNFQDYEYFKTMMTKRNTQLQIQTVEAMKRGDTGQVDTAALAQEVANKNKGKKVAMDKEIESALKMSLLEEEQNRKINAIEEAELRRALRLSEMENLRKNPKEKPMVWSEMNKKQELKPAPKIDQPKVEDKPKVNINMSSQIDKSKSIGSVVASSSIQSANKGFGKQLEKYNKDFGVKQDKTTTDKKTDLLESKIIEKSEIINAYPDLNKPNDIKDPIKSKVITPQFDPQKVPSENLIDDDEDPWKEPEQCKNIIEEKTLPSSKDNFQDMFPITQIPVQKEKIITPIQAKKPEPVKEERKENISIDVNPNMKPQIVQEEKPKANAQEPKETPIKIQSKKPAKEEVQERVIPTSTPMKIPQIISTGEEQENIETGKFNFIQKKKESEKIVVIDEAQPKNDIVEEQKVLQNSFMNSSKNTNNFIGKNDLKLAKIKEKKLGQFFPQYNQITGGQKTELNSIYTKPVASVIDTDQDHDLLQKVDDVEKDKAAEMKKYREQLLQMKREKRKAKEESELTQEELIKLEKRHELADKLKIKK